MHDFTPVPALIGGALIGLSASILLFTHGKVAGISGLYAGALRSDTPDRKMRVAFLFGLVAAGAVLRLLSPRLFESSWTPPLALALAAGLVVGVGTRLGGGCTSGHGVCGLSRLSGRSLVATMTFMAFGFLTVFVVRHVLGGRS
jgi:hypothetical protein